MTNAQELGSLSDKLISYLRDRFATPTMGYRSSLRQLQGGYETSTYGFELAGAPAELAGPLVLRLYPRLRGTRSAVWESTLQNVLAAEGYPVARVYVVCTDMSVLGGAFYIMDYLPGHPLAFAPQETVPELLGVTHAALHALDPAPLVKALNDKGIDASSYGLTGRFDWLRTKADEMPWIRQCATWLLNNRPPEPQQLAVCHGDFHVFNILYADGRVTGVLDWPGFAVTDPVYDVGNTAVVMTIPAKHLAASMDGFASVDWDLVVELYLAAYRAHKPLDDTNLDYYRVRRCVTALVEGVEGHKVWQHPLIVEDLLATILDITGVRVAMPA